MNTDMKCVLFTDESRATLDGPDGWSKGWVFDGDQCPTRMRRQQGGGGDMIWASIVGDELFGPVRVPSNYHKRSRAMARRDFTVANAKSLFTCTTTLLPMLPKQQLNTQSAWALRTKHR